MGDEELVLDRLYVALVTKIDADGKGADIQVGPYAAGCRCSACAGRARSTPSPTTRRAG